MEKIDLHDRKTVQAIRNAAQEVTETEGSIWKQREVYTRIAAACDWLDALLMGMEERAECPPEDAAEEECGDE